MTDDEIHNERRATQTRDIGLAIRDFCDAQPIFHVNEEGKYEGTDVVNHIDVSNPDSPVLHLESGAIFTIRIVRTA